MLALNKLWIRFTHSLVSKDELGNKYYESRARNDSGKKARSVIYLNEAEPSKVPPMFHAWLHYLTDEIPSAAHYNFAWQKAYMPNMTGTQLAYSPLGNRDKRVKVSSDYRSWQPN